LDNLGKTALANQIDSIIKDSAQDIDEILNNVWINIIEDEKNKAKEKEMPRLEIEEPEIEEVSKDPENKEERGIAVINDPEEEEKDSEIITLPMSSKASLIANLFKLAYNIDQEGLYSEADEIEKVMKIMTERVGLSVKDMISLADEFDSAGNHKEAEAIDTMLKRTAEKNKDLFDEWLKIEHDFLYKVDMFGGKCKTQLDSTKSKIVRKLCDQIYEQLRYSPSNIKIKSILDGLSSSTELNASEEIDILKIADKKHEEHTMTPEEIWMDKAYQFARQEGIAPLHGDFKTFFLGNEGYFADKKYDDALEEYTQYIDSAEPKDINIKKKLWAEVEKANAWKDKIKRREDIKAKKWH
jgi:hypothetical protein